MSHQQLTAKSTSRSPLDVYDGIADGSSNGLSHGLAVTVA